MGFIPVSPTFFLQVLHLFFFFLSGLESGEAVSLVSALPPVKKRLQFRPNQKISVFLVTV